MKTIFFFLITAACTTLSGKELVIASEGKTAHNIVLAGSQNEVNDFAAKELAYFLEKVTGAEFKVAAEATSQSIFIGAPDSATAILKDQEFAIRTREDCLHLYGKGLHGNLYAVYEYLERFAGIRWYSAYGDMKIPSRRELKHEPLNLQGVYAFPIRSTQTFFYRKNPGEAALYHFRNRQNMLLKEGDGICTLEKEYQPSVHTLSKYMHPGVDFHGDFEKKGRFHKQLDWIGNKNYFKTNPEWFPMNKDGERYTHGQLCFSNLDMRRELFKNALTHLDKEIRRTQSEKGVFTLDVNDLMYEKMCFCPGCLKLEEKYECAGGAFFEMLFEFCKEVQKRYPAVCVKTTAYLHTIRAPQGLEIPANLIVIFCPIYANYLSSLEGEKDQNTMTILKGWTDRKARVWYWHYPLPYRDQNQYLFLPPIANLERLSSDIRTLSEAGVEGTWFEHDSGGTDRTNFFELQSWLMLRLFQNSHQNRDSLIQEFTEFYYGKAAALFREYLYDIDKENQKLARAHRRAVYNTIDFEYLTKENFDKWKQLFNQMEQQVKNDPASLYHIKLSRLGMEAASVTEAANTSSWEQVAPMVEKVKKEILYLNEKMNYSFDWNRIEKWEEAIQDNIRKRAE